MTKKLLIITIIVMVISVTGLLIYLYTHPYNGVTMSFDEILNDINERRGSDLKAFEDGNKLYSGIRLHSVMRYYESLAIKVLENNAQVDRLWHERTGIPPEALKSEEIRAEILMLPNTQDVIVGESYSENWQNGAEHVSVTLILNDGSTLTNQEIKAIEEIIRGFHPGILYENISIS